MKKDKAIIVGLLVILLFAILIWGLNFMKGRNVFSKEKTYFAVYEEINGLQTNTGIYLRGFKVGQVRNIRFTSSAYDRILVEFAIADDVLMPENTVARIFSSDIMGTKSINLLFPEERSNQYHKANDTLISASEAGIMEQVRMEIAPYKVQIDNIMEATLSTVEQLKTLVNKNTATSLHKSLANLQSAIVAIEHAAKGADKILTDNSENLDNILTNMSDFSQTLQEKTPQINRVIDNLDVFADSLSQANVQSLINNANATASELQQLTKKLNNGEGTLGALMNDEKLYENLETTSAQLNKLLIDIQKNPKRYVSFPLFGRKTKDSETQQAQ